MKLYVKDKQAAYRVATPDEIIESAKRAIARRFRHGTRITSPDASRQSPRDGKHRFDLMDAVGIIDDETLSIIRDWVNDPFSPSPKESPRNRAAFFLLTAATK